MTTIYWREDTSYFYERRLVLPIEHVLTADILARTIEDDMRYHSEADAIEKWRGYSTKHVRHLVSMELLEHGVRGRWNGRPSAYTFVDKHLSGFLGDKIALESELLMSQVVGAVVFALRGEFHVEKDVLQARSDIERFNAALSTERVIAMIAPLVAAEGESFHSARHELLRPHAEQIVARHLPEVARCPRDGYFFVRHGEDRVPVFCANVCPEHARGREEVIGQRPLYADGSDAAPQRCEFAAAIPLLGGGR